MTAVTGLFTVRVMVTDVWDHVALAVGADTPVAELKRQALERARRRPATDADDYEIKFRGGLVVDERATVGALGARPGSAFIVLPKRRQPVR